MISRKKPTSLVCSGFASVLLFLVAATGMSEDLPLPWCSGKVEHSGIDCTVERSCKIEENPSCLDRIQNFTTKEECNSTGALPADNCWTTVNTEDCGARYDCRLSASGQFCRTSITKLADVLYFLTDDDDDCVPKG